MPESDLMNLVNFHLRSSGSLDRNVATSTPRREGYAGIAQVETELSSTTPCAQVRRVPDRQKRESASTVRLTSLKFPKAKGSILH
jgi:hypothetical protein